jgi:cysteinyl-tRNA synthetase
MAGLGVKAPTHDPHATAYVDQMVALIAELVAKDKAYETSDGVYLATDTVEDYGLLARQSLDSLQTGGGEREIVGEAEKRSPLDFALWKKAKEGEPAWPSPWGDGRPGWHTECVVMSLDLLGEDFDLHGGGRDLAFPHHENERAQAVALGKRFSRRWMHNGWVEVDGVKMSKSLKNFTSLVDLLERHDGRAYRLLILRSHYRSPLEVTPETIVDAEEGLARLDAVTRRFPEHVDAPIDQDAVGRFNALMDDDLKTPDAMGLVFALVRQANTEADAGNVDAARSLTATVVALSGAVGLALRGRGEVVDVEINDLIGLRDQARADKDFAEADRIRAELEERGWTVEDTPGGTRVHR